MCGRYYRTAAPETISDVFRAALPEDDSFPFGPAYNIAPTTTQPVIRENRDSRLREIVPMRWGLVGYNSSGPDPKRSTFNARSETLNSSGLWRTPLHRHRCIVPADGFYEWFKPTREAWRFALSAGRPMGLAGLWDAWKDPTNGQWLQSYAIITVPANTLLSSIHDRMPAILEPKDYGRWLDREELERPLTDLLRPFESNFMEKYHAHTKVGNVRNQGPEMLGLAMVNSA